MATVALLFATYPNMRWYFLRLQDGGGEIAGLVPFAAAMWFAFRDREQLGMRSVGVWVGAVLLVLQAAAIPFLPAMIRALLMVAAVATVYGIWRKPGIPCLLVLSLPWTASLDFFLGYPLRLMTSVNSAFLLGMVGTDVTRSGVQLVYEGRVVGVDPACSGMNLLWSTGLLTALLAAVFSLRWRAMVPLSLVALALALVGNSVRAALLFFPEAGIIGMPHILHSGIGIAIAGGCFFILMKFARKFPAHGAPLSGGVCSGNLQPHAVPAAAAASLLVFLASLFSGKETIRSNPNPPVLTSYREDPVIRIPLGLAETKFYGNFPGSIAVYEGPDFKLIVRQVTRATRKLHPASHCLRAEGFRIGEKRVERKDGAPWLTYRATRGGNTFLVKEQITSPADYRNWAEVSAWYWHALLHPGDGPWEAVTVIEL